MEAWQRAAFGHFTHTSRQELPRLVVVYSDRDRGETMGFPSDGKHRHNCVLTGHTGAAENK